MKKLLILLFVIGASNVLGQDLIYEEWVEIETVDEFGDSTGNVVKRYLCKGKFSNSATSGSDMTVKVIDFGESIAITIYEYNRSAAQLAYRATPGSIKIKRANGLVEVHPGWAMEDLTVYFSNNNKSQGKEFIQLIQSGNGEKLKVVIDEDDFGGGSSKYTFELVTQ